MKTTDVIRKGGEMWGALSDADKEPYNKMREVDILRHEREMKEFNENGYFINAQGVNSKDL